MASKKEFKRKSTLHILMAQLRFPYPLYISGADVCNLSFLKALSKKGHRVQALYCSGPTTLEFIQARLSKHGISSKIENKTLTYTWQSVPIMTTTSTSFSEQLNVMETSFQPDWIWHHNSLFPELDISSIPIFTSCQHFAYIQYPGALKQLLPLKSRLNLIFTNSKYAQNEIQNSWKRETPILYPVPEKDPVLTTLGPENRHYITMINPHKAKGGAILHHLIQTFPQHNFLIIPGWEGALPKEFDFSSFKNVLVYRSTTDMASVYGHTRLLLMPSQWNEYFGRIQIEAAYNHIPVLASQVGGIPEIFKGNGLLIKDYQNVEEWEKAIVAMDDPDTYSQAVACCDKVQDTFSFDKEVDKLEQALLEGQQKN